MTLKTVALSLALLAITSLPQSFAGDTQLRPVLDRKSGVEAKYSNPDWPKPVTALEQAPNIVIILLDDAGFSDASTFGGAVQTPELSRLAARGLRYNNFNTTSMCSPTRAALLSGRNHHQVGFGRIAEIPDGFPGYDSLWKKNAAPIAEVLRRNGYSTGAFGKWHNTPVWEITPIGPFDRWPTGLGFEYFYGFMGGWENHWEPSKLYRGITPVEAPARPDQGYHLTTDIIDEAIRWVHTNDSLAPEKPYFLYVATGAPHGPAHVPRRWTEAYRGRFDQGWDRLRKEVFARQKQLGVVPANTKLTPRPGGLPAWNSLSADQKRLYARQMEVYAGFLAHTDHEVGRLLDAIHKSARSANTLILYIVGDNGSSGMGGLGGDDLYGPNPLLSDRLQQIDELGGPLRMSQYAAGWAWAGSTPFQGLKGIASHFGGLRAPLVVSWPARIKDIGGLRSQFTHVTDVAPTLYEAAMIRPPDILDGVKQLPLEGTSLVPTFDDASTPSSHRVQYFEMWGNRAIYKDGWMAAARHDRAWDAGGWSDPESAVHRDVAEDSWQLYDVTQDFSQALNLAAKHPKRLRELQSLFDAEASRNDVYPLTTGPDFARLVNNIPWITKGKRKFVYHSDLPRIAAGAVPNLSHSSYRITAHLVVPQSGAQGVILAWGERLGGLVLYVKDDRLIFESNSGLSRDVLASDVPLPRGAFPVAFEFSSQERQHGPNIERGVNVGLGRLYINGQMAGEAEITEATPFAGGLGVGRAFGSPISSAFEVPFAFTGEIEKVTMEIGPASDDLLQPSAE